jgi:hypothetical protein
LGDIIHSGRFQPGIPGARHHGGTLLIGSYEYDVWFFHFAFHAGFAAKQKKCAGNQGCISQKYITFHLFIQGF